MTMNVLDEEKLKEAAFQFCETVVPISPVRKDEAIKYYTAGAHYAAEQLEKKLPTWIPCKERLPEKDGEYIVYGCGIVGAMDFVSGKWVTLFTIPADQSKITHWMPLPEFVELPKEKEEKK
jgi:hypothetical protein